MVASQSRPLDLDVGKPTSTTRSTQIPTAAVTGYLLPFRRRQERTPCAGRMHRFVQASNRWDWGAQLLVRVTPSGAGPVKRLTTRDVVQAVVGSVLTTCLHLGASAPCLVYEDVICPPPTVDVVLGSVSALENHELLIVARQMHDGRCEDAGSLLRGRCDAGLPRLTEFLRRQGDGWAFCTQPAAAFPVRFRASCHMEFSPDDRVIAWGGAPGAFVDVWEVARGRRLQQWDLPSLFRGFLFTSHHTVLAWDSSGRFSAWDTHVNNFTQLRDTLLPQLDQGLSALLADLEERGLLDETLVYCTGEFGRTPLVNSSAGRDHWAQSMTALLAGGGSRRGFVYGATNAEGSEPIENACTPDDLAATVMSQLGLAPEQTVTHRSGRPLPLFKQGHVLEALCQ